MNIAVSMPITVPNDSQSQRDIFLYFKILYSNAPQNTFIGLSLQKVGQKTLETYFFSIDDQDRIIRRIEQKRQNHNIYLRVAPLTAKPIDGRGDANLSAGSAVLWVDIDLDDVTRVVDALARLALPPTNAINSGHGIHAYWQLETFCTDHNAIREANRALQLEVNQVLQADVADDVYDLARIMRVPGSVNLKNGSPQRTHIIQSDPTRIYSIDQFPKIPTVDTPNYCWDASDLPLDFLDVIQDRDKKLYNRILSHKTAVRSAAPTTTNGDIDISRNDAYIVTRLLTLGYAPSVCLAVLTHDDWLSGEKYRRTLRYGYVTRTVNSAWKIYQKSPDRFFVGKNLQTKLMAETVETLYPFMYTASTLYRYVDGVYQPDGTRIVNQYILEQLGARWSTYSANEVLEWLYRKFDMPLDQVMLRVKEFRGVVNVQNGMIDAKTGKLLPHDQKYLSINQLPIVYDPNAKTSVVDQFVSDIIPNDAIPVFWEFIGSAFIQDDYWPKAFMALVGRGDSGKSKLLSFIYSFFGGKKNASAMSFQMLTDQRFTAAHLFGKLVNIFNDLDETEAQNIGRIKALTGDDTLTAEQKYKTPFEFKNTARLFFSANHQPIVKSPDEAYFNRAYIIPCTNHFVAGENAKEFILDELCTPNNFSAVLLRAMQGLQRLLAQHRFTFSQSIQDARVEYRYAADTVLGFFNALTVIDTNETGFISKDEIYTKYKNWCANGRRSPFGEDKFFKRIASYTETLKITPHYPTVGNDSRKHGWLGRRYLLENERFEFRS